MERSTEMSTRNRTGMSRLDSQLTIDMAEHTPPSPAGDTTALQAIESTYIREAEPVGSVPVPGTVTGAAQAIANKLTGKNPEVFIDKLGESPAFERTGTRLYDYLITECETLKADSGIAACPAKSRSKGHTTMPA